MISAGNIRRPNSSLGFKSEHVPIEITIPQNIVGCSSCSSTSIFNQLPPNAF